jgi:branched-subunit amino acid aminotransferase/4-amino-4-deoxychorismate lyase
MSLLSETLFMLDDHMRRLMRHRERYVKAWIAETGFKPSECEIVEESTSTPSGFQSVIRVRRRSGE